MDAILQPSPKVREALATGRPVVALETSVVAQGLPRRRTWTRRDDGIAAREAGSVPAFIAVIGGRVVVGAGKGELSRRADPANRAAKAGARELAALLVAR